MGGTTKQSIFLERLLLLLFVGILTIALTACSQTPKAQTSAEQQQPSGRNQEEPANPAEDKVYEGKIKETKEYLSKLGLIPLEPVTQSPEGDERTITWEDLATKQEAMLLNAFLDRSIQKASEKKAYGPVDLRTVVFQLEKGLMAEVYFYEDRMIGGVTYPEQQAGLELKDYRTLEGETLAQIRQLDFPVWQAGQAQPKEPAIFYLEAKQAIKDGFEHAIQAFSLGQGKTLIVFKNDLEIRAYVYDIKTGSDFYTGISTREDYLPIRVKPLEENQAAVMLEEKLLIVNQEDFKVLKTMNYPEKELSLDDLDITPDGRTIVLAGKKGLSVYDGNFEKGKILVPSKIGTNPHDMDTEAPRYPVLSPDSSRILYRMCGYEWLVGTGTIALDGSDHHYFKADQEETTFVKWFDDEHIYSVGSPYAGENPVIRNINTNKETRLVKDATQDGNTRYFLGKDHQRLFTLETIFDEDYNPITAKLGYYDLVKGTRHTLMESKGFHHLDWYLSAYDPQEDSFVISINNHPLPSKAAILIGFR